MKLFMISYDLRNPGRNYQPLWDELRRLGARRSLESLWWLHIDVTATALRDHLRRFIDGNDGLMVMQVTDWASVGTQSTPNEAKV